MSVLIRKLTHHPRTPGASSGQALMEYALILVLVAVICIVVLAALGDDIARTYETMLCEIEGGDNCMCDAREAFIVGPDFVCAGNSFSFQTLTSCRDQTELALKIDYPDNTSTTHGLVYDESRGLFYTSFVSPSLCASIDGGTPPLGAVISEHTDNEYLNTLPFSFSGAPAGSSDPGGSDPGGSDPGGSDPGGSDPGGSDPGSSDPGGSDPGGSDPGGGGLPPGDDGDDGGDDEEALPPTLPAIDPVTMQETQPTTINFSATPPSGSGPVTFSAMNLTVTWMTFTDNGNNTATLRLEPERGHAGEYDVTIVATGDNDSSSSQAFSITVNAAPNRSPVITDIDDQTVEAGGTLEIPVTVSDDDGDDVSITVSGAAFVSESDNPIIATPDTSDVGPHTITVTASDGKGGTASRTFTITVEQPAAQSQRVEDGLLALYRFESQYISNHTVENLAAEGDSLSDLTFCHTISWEIGWRLVQQPHSLKVQDSCLQTGNISSIIGGMQSGNAFTIEMWLKPSWTWQGKSEEGGWMPIFTISDGDQRNITIGHGRLENDIDATHINIHMRTDNGQGVVTAHNITGARFTNTPPAHHLVFIQNGNSNALYLDGQPISIPNWPSSLQSWGSSGRSGYPLTLGNESNSSFESGWAGEFFLVAIYGHALTSTQVQTNFNAAEPWK